MKEVWVPIKGFEGAYEVSNHGRVKSLERIVRRKDGRHFMKKEAILSGGKKGQGGYLSVELRDNGKRASEYIHRLVASHFHGQPKGDRIHVNHKDGNKINNHADNLEWVTPRENVIHAMETGLNKFYGEDNPVCKYSDRTVMEIRDLYDNGIYRQYELSNMYGISRMQVNRIVRRILRVGGRQYANK